MKKKLRRRFWAEIVLAASSGILSAITVVWPDWIEMITGWDPDQHSGSVEWIIASGLFSAAVTTLAMATLEWRRTPLAESS
jgi:hypothetical protein